MENPDQEFDPLERFKPPPSPEPLDSSDIRQTVRVVQDRHLSRLEEQLEERKAREHEHAMHLARIHALRQHLATFVRLMHKHGGPGAKYFPGSGLSLSDRILGVPKTMPAVHFWPIAKRRLDELPFIARIAAGEYETLALTTKGEWWVCVSVERPGKGGPVKGSYPLVKGFDLVRRHKLVDLTGLTSFKSIGETVSCTTVDRAAMGTVAEILDRHKLSWP